MAESSTDFEDVVVVQSFATVGGEGVAGEGRREVRRGVGERPGYDGPSGPFSGDDGHGSGLCGRFEADERRAAQNLLDSGQAVQPRHSIPDSGPVLARMMVAGES
jgi:hypothetical protein